MDTDLSRLGTSSENETRSLFPFQHTRYGHNIILYYLEMSQKLRILKSGVAANRIQQKRLCSACNLGLC